MKIEVLKEWYAQLIGMVIGLSIAYLLLPDLVPKNIYGWVMVGVSYIVINHLMNKFICDPLIAWSKKRNSR